MSDTNLKEVNSLQLVSYVVKTCKGNGMDLNMTKLQRILYCCYGTVMAKFGFRVLDESPVAWPYGPVFPFARHSIKYFGLDFFSTTDSSAISALPEDVRSLIDDAILHFGTFTAVQLSKWSCLPGSPWYEATGGGKDFYAQLDDGLVAEYFRKEVLM